MKKIFIPLIELSLRITGGLGLAYIFGVLLWVIGVFFFSYVHQNFRLVGGHIIYDFILTTISAEKAFEKKIDVHTPPPMKALNLIFHYEAIFPIDPRFGLIMTVSEKIVTSTERPLSSYENKAPVQHKEIILFTAQN